jgi:hypothetical protein
MARKLTFTWGGKVIGKRTTDRIYTHVVAMVDFDGEVLRRQYAKHEAAANEMQTDSWKLYQLWQNTPLGVQSTEITTRYGKRELQWPWPVSQENKNSAAKALAGCENLTLFLEMQAGMRALRLDKLVADMAERGNCVLSWHGTRDLAFKAQSAARDKHPAYLLLVEPVDKVG